MRRSWATALLVLTLPQCDGGRPTTPGTPGGGSPRDGGPTTTNPGGGAGALAMGDVVGAFGAFSASAQPADAAGTCVSRILRLGESAAATQVLAAFGWPALRMRDVVGPDSALSRPARRWNGSATVSWPGRTVQIPRARVDVSGRAAGRDLDRQNRVSVFGLPTPGSTLVGAVDCASGDVSFPGDLYASVLLPGESCSLASRVETGPTCSGMVGSVSVSPAGARVGDPVEVRLDDVPLLCSGSPTPVSASLYFSARLSDETLDSAGLHPMLGATDLRAVIAQAQSGVTVEQLVDRLQPWVGELSSAADECARAADAGATFRLPGALWSGDDLDLTPGDLYVLAGLADAAAAALSIGGAYRAPLEIRPLCQPTACVEAADLVARVNAATGGLASAADVTRARMLAQAALDRLQSGAARLDAGSAWQRNADSAMGVDEARLLFEELARSLSTSAPVTLSGVTPSTRVELARFFTMPPNPDNIAADPLVVENGNVVLVEAFFDAFFAGAAEVTWSGASYQGPALDRVFGALGDRLSSRGWFVGE